MGSFVGVAPDMLVISLAIRNAYNQVRQGSDAKRRLTSPEFAVLCHLIDVGTPVSVSQIAKHQEALRPTMTHRTKRLRSMGHMECVPGETDRRQVMCSVTEDGRRRVEELCRAYYELTRQRSKSLRLTTDRMCCYIDGMGTFECDASDLVLLAVHVLDPDECALSGIVRFLDLMQPTVSMSVARLEESGLLERETDDGRRRGDRITLTDAGQERVCLLAEHIDGISIPRRRVATAD